MKKILVVEDDQFFREAISDLLQKHYSILQAPNGKVAREILSLQPVDLVLSDIQMPLLTGIELLEWSIQNNPVPFLIMTGFSTILETKSAFDLGAKGFIAKPFKNAELFIAIDAILGGASAEVVPAAAPEYCKVSIDEFVARPHIDFDVFIKLSDLKVIKIAHKGDEIPVEKLNHYKEKGLKHLHILKQDFGQLVQFNLNLAKVVQASSAISSEKKLNFLKYTAETMLEKVFIGGLDKQSLKDAQDFMKLSLDAISKSEENVDLLNSLANHSDKIYAHSMGVSLYAVMIGQKLGYESNAVLFKLSTAGLYHDIGKKEIDRAILDKPRHLLSHEERKLIESHAVRSQEILREMPGLHEEVAQLAYEHHEDLAGQGYPMGKKKIELHPLSKIIQAANIFVDLTVGIKAISGSAAIAQMEKIYGARLDGQVLTALKSLFKPAISQAS